MDFIGKLLSVVGIIFLIHACWRVFGKKMIVLLQNEIRWRRRPLVFADERGGVVGLVLARNYRRGQKKNWRQREDFGWNNWNGHVWNMSNRPKVEDVMKFGDLIAEKQGSLTGTMEDFHWLTSGCRTERGYFEVPAPWHLRNNDAPEIPLVTAAEMIYGRSRARKMIAERRFNNWRDA